jgi:hypothetical protein
MVHLSVQSEQDAQFFEFGRSFSIKVYTRNLLPHFNVFIICMVRALRVSLDVIERRLANFSHSIARTREGQRF